MVTGVSYRLRVADPSGLEALLEHVRSQAELRSWLVADATPRQLAAARLRAIEGPVADAREMHLAGLWVNPHFASDDLCLVFDRGSGDLVDDSLAAADDPSPQVNDFAITRTTFAGADTHLAVVEFLEGLAERDLASLEIGDARGGAVDRDPAAIEAAMRSARVAALQSHLTRPEEPFTLAGVLPFLAPAEAISRRAAAPTATGLLDKREADALEQARDALFASWGPSTPGLDGSPAQTIAALERLMDQLLSSPEHRHDPTYLENTFVWQAGATFGFALIDALGGHWERVPGDDGTGLRIANLGGTGLTWSPLRSAVDRLRVGPLHAYDAIYTWLVSMNEAAGDAFADGREE